MSKNIISSKELRPGLIFGKLTVVKNLNGVAPAKANWECLCSCGQTTIAVGKRLLNGIKSSCGCLRSENSGRRKHGQGSKGKETPEYKTWMNMLSRCGESKCIKERNTYKNYKGRGIEVCERWKNSFQNFFDDMGKRPSQAHSIDRKNNNLGYSSENCRWATNKEQCNNRRGNKLITVKGETKTLQEWSELFNIKHSIILKRIMRGWPVEDAIKTPVLDRKTKIAHSFNKELTLIENEKVVRLRTQEDRVHISNQEPLEEDED